MHLRRYTSIHIISALICIVTVLTYLSSLGNSYVRWDDDLLVYDNPPVQELSLKSIQWAFTHFDPELYIPLTFLTYQIEWQIGSGAPWIFHVSNLLLHVANVILVIAITQLLFRKKVIALLTGALFALHPLHTETVVWIAARKDVLSSFFFLLSVLLYILYTKQLISRKLLYMSIGTFALGLLSKVSIILLPFILLLVDWWQRRSWSREMCIEKIPYFVLSCIFGCVAILGKQQALESSTAVEKLLMACKSTVFYLQKLLIPTNLSVLYPHRGSIEFFDPAFLIPVLILIALLIAIYHLRKQKTILLSFVFFMIMLLPSFSNFAKAGELYIASDRYAYLASIGFFWLIAKCIDSVISGSAFADSRIDATNSPIQSEQDRSQFFRSNYGICSIFTHFRRICSIFTIVLLCASLALLSYKQSLVWKSTESLMEHVLTIYPDSHIAHNNIGVEIASNDRMDEMEKCFKRALELKPTFADAHNNLGVLYMQQKRYAEAQQHFRKALQSEPGHKRAGMNLQDLLQIEN